MKFFVSLQALADVSTVVEVEATEPEEAEEKALAEAQEGGVTWKYCGVVDDPRIVVAGVRREPLPELRCRYRDCAAGHPVSQEQEQTTCPSCRADMGLPPLEEA